MVFGKLSLLIPEELISHHPLQDRKKVLFLQSSQTPFALVSLFEKIDCYFHLEKITKKTPLSTHLDKISPDIIIAPLHLEKKIELDFNKRRLTKPIQVVFYEPKLSASDLKLKALICKNSHVRLAKSSENFEKNTISSSIFFFCKKNSPSLLLENTCFKNRLSLGISKKNLFKVLQSANNDLILMLPLKKTLSLEKKKVVTKLEKNIKDFAKKNPSKKIMVQNYRDFSLEPWNIVFQPKFFLTLKNGKKLFRHEEKLYLFIKVFGN